MRRIASTLAAVTLASTFITGCGDESSDDAATTATTDTTSTTSITATSTSTTPGDTASSTVVEGAPPVTTDPDLVTPTGFDRVDATVTAADGTVGELCLWLAAEPEQRSQGLRAVDDIGDADGMVFVFDSPSQRAFTMVGVRIDLSIAFFDETGEYLDDFDMEACPEGGCDNYPTPPEILYALEARPGALPSLGIGPGSILAVGDGSC